MKTGQFIKMKRKALDMTMKDLAEKVGVSEATVSRWESGEIENMRSDKLNALVRALEVTPAEIMFEWDVPSDLLAFQSNTKPHDPIEGAFIERLRKMDSDQKLRLMLYMDKILKMTERKEENDGEED